MSIATLPRPDSLTELEDEVRHVRDLVVLRNLLARRGATPDELDDFAVVIDQARTKLAETAKLASSRYAAAA
jgi:hypothetical protein